MIDAFSVTTESPAVPDTFTTRPTVQVAEPVPRELRQFLARVRAAVKSSQPARKSGKSARKPRT